MGCRISIPVPVKGKPMVIDALRFLLIVFVLAALSHNLLRMDSPGLQMSLNSVSRTVLAEAFLSMLLTKDALAWHRVQVLESLDGSSYPCQAPGEGTSPLLTLLEQTTKRLSLTCVQIRGFLHFISVSDNTYTVQNKGEIQADEGQSSLLSVGLSGKDQLSESFRYQLQSQGVNSLFPPV